ncbi:MAG TPA: paraquat-inducible protein A, partial [Chryseosolibacter sp.]|nr:paraquat-inducible protein A [Chryseosolibacter sp.]
EEKSRPFKIALMLVTLVTAIYIAVVRLTTQTDYLLLTLVSFVLLATGLVLPMIEIDARISSLSFTLLGESVTFKDQVLYYKSKSILEVVQLMLTQDRVDVLLVGVLVFVFSVLFPIAKLLASMVYMYSARSRDNRTVRFLIFQTGKWSMADVMVIAIFMSYIGFSGIITEQLRQIETIAGNIDILTTNKSSLLSGFFCFTSFAIISLLISHKLQFQFKKVAGPQA